MEIIINTINAVIFGLDKSHIPLDAHITSNNIIDEKVTIDITLLDTEQSKKSPLN